MFKRNLNLSLLLSIRSHFLFGPRGTGKSTLIDINLGNIKNYDLLDPDVFQRLTRFPKSISEETKKEEWIVIDEIQKLPMLLDEVHRLIVKRKNRFLLTGSSARKLKRGSANLLAGRAFKAELFPLVSNEIPNFSLIDYMNTTALPEFHQDKLAKDFLNAYIGTYLKEEIQSEALTRNLPDFSHFLEVCALQNGEEVVFANMSSDTGIKVKTIESYFSILEDTLIGFMVPGFTQTKKRKAITRAKHYFFDVGVVRSLTKRGIIELGSELFGKALEHFIVLELRAYLSYSKVDETIYYWRSTTGFEVDFIIGSQLAIEVKSTNHVNDKQLKGIRALKEESIIKSFCVVSTDPNLRITDDGITIYPYELFLKKLWNHELIQ